MNKRKFSIRKLKKTKSKPTIRAKKCSQDGINFDSKSELFCYNLLKSNGLYGVGKFIREPETYTIVEGFTYMGKKLRPIQVTPDFVDENKKIVIEIKGWATPVFEMRWKLFKRFLLLNNKEYKLYVVRATQKDMIEAINKIKKEYYEDIK